MTHEELMLRAVKSTRMKPRTIEAARLVLVEEMKTHHKKTGRANCRVPFYRVIESRQVIKRLRAI